MTNYSSLFGISIFLRCRALYTLVIILFFFYSPNSQAKTVQDFGIWTNISVTGGFGFINPEANKLRFYFSNRTSFMNDASQLSQNRVLLGLGYKVNKNWTFMGGWGDEYSTSPYVENGSRMSNRLWQQAFWQEKFVYYTLASRTRFEERLIDGESQIHWRVRQLVEIIIPFGFLPTLGLVVNDEVFWNLNKVGSNNEYGINGFSQNRFFLGLQYQLTKHMHIDVGYMNQYIQQNTNDTSYMGNAVYTGFGLVLP